MTNKEAKEILIQYNRWRRDDSVPNKYEMLDPKLIGQAIDKGILALGAVFDEE